MLIRCSEFFGHLFSLHSAEQSPVSSAQDLDHETMDLLNRTRSKKPLNWYKTLKSYYYRNEWELYDLKRDAEEVNNVASKPAYKNILLELKTRLDEWQKATADPWLCAPGGVLEATGSFKKHPQCLPLDNF